jgi:hypothetical protein
VVPEALTPTADANFGNGQSVIMLIDLEMMSVGDDSADTFWDASIVARQPGKVSKPCVHVGVKSRSLNPIGSSTKDLPEGRLHCCPKAKMEQMQNSINHVNSLWSRCKAGGLRVGEVQSATSPGEADTQARNEVTEIAVTA